VRDSIRFQAEDVARWARLSGDYNPVHFDDGAARASGFTGRIVHGMLAMLELKRRFDGDVGGPGPGQARWWAFQCQLKNGIPIGASTTVKAGRRGEERNFSLVLPDGRKAVIGRAHRLDEPGPEGPGPLGPASVLTEGEVDRRLAALADAFPPLPGWVATDAILFEVYLGGGINRALRPLGLDLGRDGWGALPGSGRVVLQTGHDVAFDPSAFGVAGDESVPRPLEVVPLMPEAHAVDGGTHLTQSWQVRHDGRVVMRTEIRLMILNREPFSPSQEPAP
jgi:hypothetical protein